MTYFFTLETKKQFFLLTLFLFLYTVSNAQCNPTISPVSTSICAGNSVILTASGASSYSWAPSTNLSSTSGASVTANPTVTTIYTVTGTCGDSTGTKTITVTVNPLPAAPVITIINDNECAGSTVGFSTPSGSGVTFSWNFGDGSSLVSGSNVSHIYNPAFGNGTQSYTVTVTATNSFGCVRSTNQTVTVKKKPVASIYDENSAIQFTNCGSSNFELTIGNNSTTSNSNYQINWGDGTSPYSSTNLPTSGTIHNYNTQGYFTLTLSVTGNNSCVSTKTYTVYNGSNPAVGLGNPGTTVELCLPFSLSFPITGASANPPGTTYTISINDGSADIIFSHPPPANFSHYFTTSSCNSSPTGLTPNTFFVKIRAANPCGWSESIVSPITTVTKPEANFSISPDTIACVNSTVTFTNTSIAGIDVNNSGTCNLTTAILWQTSPSTPVNIVSGTLGYSLNTNNPAGWGSNILGLSFSEPGLYDVSLFVKGPINNCGRDTIQKTVCIQAPPVPSFTSSSLVGCGPLVVNFTNTSTGLPTCGSISRQWTVTKAGSTCVADSTIDYRYISGTNSSSLDPIIRFNNQGTYNVTFSLTNICGTFTTSSVTVTVKRKPQVAITVPANICFGQSISPTATVTNCAINSLSYLWTFNGGTPSSSILATPPAISFSTTGSHTVSLAVTNECGTTTVSSAVNILPIPIANAGIDQPICTGGSISIGTASTAGLTYLWSPTTGLSSSIISNPTISLTNTGTTAIQNTYTVTVTNISNCSVADAVTITTNPLPLISCTSQTICIGDTASLTASGGNSYSWNPTSSTSNPLLVSPTATTNYTVTGTSTVTGCSNTAVGTVTVNPLPVVNAGPSILLCNQPISNTLTGYSPPGGTWTGTNVTSAGVFTPSGSGSYVLTYSYTIPTTGCVNSDTIIVKVVDPQLANAGTGFSKCIGFIPVTLTGFSPSLGTWSGPNVTSAGVFTPSAPVTSVLTYTFGTGTCLTSDTIHIQVNALPVISATSQTICLGATASLPASGGDTYSWNAGSSTSNPLLVSPTATTNYTVTGTSTLTGCSNTAVGTVTVNPLPVVNAGPSILLCNQPISNTLTGYSPPGGTWTGTNVTSAGVFTPSGSGSYTLTYSYTIPTTGCVNSDTMIVKVVDPQIANAGTGFSKCINSSPVTLSGFSPSLGTWSGTNVTSAGVFTPSAAGTSILTYTFGSGTCLTSDTIQIQVNALPIISATSQTICYGATASLTASGGDTYSWNPTSSTSNPLSDSPSATTNYTVTGTSNVTGCSNTAVGTVTVNPLPVVNAGPSIQLCNQPISNTLSGYSPVGGTWTGTNVTSAGVFTPSGSGSFILTYSYTIPTTGCVNSDTMIVKVVDPQIANAGTGFSKCINSSPVTLSGFSPSLGTWSGTNVTSAGVFTPSAAGTSILTYTFGTGTCLTSDTIHIQVNALPIITVNSQTICYGVSASLTASGGNTYSWSSSGSTSNPLLVSPHITTNYTVTGTSALTGCSNTAISTVTVNPLPVVNAGPSIQLCNQPISNTLTGYSPSGGTWAGTNVTSAGVFTPSGSGSFILTYSYTILATGCVNSDTMIVKVVAAEIANAGTGFSKCIDISPVTLNGFSPSLGTWSGTNVTSAGVFTPSTVGISILTYTFGSGTCLTSDTIHIQVNDLPLITVTSQTICYGETASLKASGGDTYSWNPTSSTSNPLLVSPTATTNYTVTGTSALTGCSNTAVGIVTVNPLPIVNAGPSIQLCDQPISNTLSGYSPAGGTWTGTNVSSSGVFTPSGTGSFILTYSYTIAATGCVNSDTMIVKVVTAEIANAGTGFSKCIYSGDSTLTGFSPALGSWSGTNVTSAGVFTPSSLGSFILTYTYGSGTCLTSDTIQIQVNALPLITVTSQTICYGETASLKASGGDTYSWNPTSSTSNPLLVSPTATTNYTVTGTSALTGCSNTAVGIVTVNPLPIVNAGPSIQLCDQPISNTLSGYSPAGGTWTGTNVSSSGVFTPSGTGSFILTYSYTIAATGCVNSDTMIVKVVDPIFAVAGNDQSICLNNGVLNLLNFSPLTGVWTGTGISNSAGEFDPLFSGIGNFTLTLTYGSGTCYTADTKTITVLPLPILSAGSDKVFCLTDAATLFVGTPVSGIWTGSGITNGPTGEFDPSAAGVGVHTIIYSVTDPVTLCTNFDTLFVTVNPLPIVNFTFNPIACLNVPQVFTNTSLLGTNPYWLFENTNSSSEVNPIYSFTTVGVFPIQLIETSLYGCMDSITQFIEVREPPVSIFTVSSDSICGPALISFVNSSTGLENTYSWSFGNNTTSTLLNPPPVLYDQGYMQDTTYLISLETSNYCGISVAEIVVKIMPQPTSIFGTDIDGGCSPILINFTNNSVGLPDNAVWDFGDGTTSTNADQNSTHIFTTLQNDTTYIVQLIEINECGSDTTEYPILVHPNTVNAFFNTNVLSGCSPLTVDFTNFSINNTFYHWDFGDGNNSTLLNPSHTFEAGEYQVALFVNNGCSYDTAYIHITVFPKLMVDFVFAPDSICINKPFMFTNLSSGLASSTWDFGDGTSSILTDPSHSYPTTGIYTVTLVGISSTNNCIAEISHQVQVKSTPIASYTSSLDNGCVPLPVSFNNTNINSDFQFWDFGDGNTSNQSNPIHLFEAAGTYVIKEVSVNVNGCMDSISHLIVVHPLPSSNFDITTSDVCFSPLIVTTTNTSVGAISYSWDFDNGQPVSLLNNPIITYYNPGTYTISLISENVFQCKDTSSLDISISPILDVSFIIPDDTICRKEVLEFYSTVNFGDSVVWDFGDGFTETGNPVWYIYPDTGAFNVSVVAYANNGCTDTSSFAEIVVLPSPTADFTSYNIELDQKPSGTIQFTNTSLLADNYIWDFGDGELSVDIDPIHKYIHNSNATVTLYAINNNGCRDTITQLIEVDFFYGLFIPSTMYPGHEAFGVANFVPIGVGIKEFEILVYDNWGNIIWQSTALDADGRPSEYWNGLFDGTVNDNGNGSGRPVQQDSYVWKANAIFMNGTIWQGNSFGKNKFIKSGTITVIR